MPQPDRKVPPHFALVVSAVWWVFLSVGMLVPIIPQWVEGELGGGGTEIGATFLVYGLATVLSRPFAAAYLARYRPEPMMLVSVVIAVGALVLTPALPQLVWMWVLRFIDGAAVGFFYTAAATGVVRSAPSGRRGSVLAYFSIPLFLGVAVGPVLGDLLLKQWGIGWTWIASGLTLMLAGTSCLPGRRLFEPFVREDADPPAKRRTLSNLIHPAALLPGGVFALSIAGWAAFSAFVPLYGPQIGVAATGTVFLTYSGVVLVIRIGGASRFDRLPVIEVVTIGTVANVLGLLVAAWWQHPVSLYLSAGLMAVAVGLMYTNLLQVALAGVPPSQEGAVVAAYSASYDIGAAAGALILGMMLTWSGSYAAVFLGGAGFGVAALILLLSQLWPRRSGFRAMVPLVD